MTNVFIPQMSISTGEKGLKAWNTIDFPHLLEIQLHLLMIIRVVLNVKI